MENPKIPEGYQTVMPYLILNDAAGFLNFTQKVFGATEKAKFMDHDKIMHAEIQIGNSTIMFADTGGQWTSQPAGLYIHVHNADEVYKAALAAGAASVQEPTNKEYGRSAGVLDPFGNTWWPVSQI